MDMTANSLWKVSISTSRAAEDAVAEMMSAVFGESCSIHHHAETLKTWVTAYLSSATPGSSTWRTVLRQQLKRIQACGLDTAPGRVSVQRIRREDWAESWKRHFHPIEISQALLIKPPWHNRKPKDGQAVVVLDPGLSFGTGQHPTTRFCLTQLAGARKRSIAQSFLDIGCGSGILSLAAAKLGYHPVEGFDCDPEAVRVAAKNVRQNRLTGKLCLRQTDLTRLPPRAVRHYDVVCANLIYDLLLREKQRILGWVKSGGLLVLAGILREQYPLVREAYQREGWAIVAQGSDGEWASVTLQNSAPDVVNLAKWLDISEQSGQNAAGFFLNFCDRARVN